MIIWSHEPKIVMKLRSMVPALFVEEQMFLDHCMSEEFADASL